MQLPIKYSAADRDQRRAARLEYAKRQQHRCYHCKGSLLSDPPQWILDTPITWRLFPGGREGFLRWPHHLHHSHRTGMTIGTVHAYCNAVLWEHHGE